jgi:hypothetical protein
LATFIDMGTQPLRLDLISSTHIRNLTARGVYLAGHIQSSADQTEFNVVQQELANRMLGREPALR